MILRPAPIAACCLALALAAGEAAACTGSANDPVHCINNGQAINGFGTFFNDNLRPAPGRTDQNVLWGDYFYVDPANAFDPPSASPSDNEQTLRKRYSNTWKWLARGGTDRIRIAPRSKRRNISIPGTDQAFFDHMDGVRDALMRRYDSDLGTGPEGTPQTSSAPPGLNDFFAFDPLFAGGVNVVAGDFDGSGRTVIVSPGADGGPPIFVNAPPPPLPGPAAGLPSFFGDDPSFRGGVRVAVGDIDGSGRASVITAPGGGTPAGTATRDDAPMPRDRTMLSYDYFNQVQTTPPPRPRVPGQTIGGMTGLIGGQAVDLDVVRQPDGKTVAVDPNGHVYGEVKQSRSGLGWRFEGPMTPPPAPQATPAGTGTAPPAATPSPAAPSTTAPSTAATTPAPAAPPLPGKKIGEMDWLNHGQVVSLVIVERPDGKTVGVVPATGHTVGELRQSRSGLGWRFEGPVTPPPAPPAVPPARVVQGS